MNACYAYLVIGEGRLRSEQLLELELERRGRGPEGELLPRGTMRVERAAQAELFEILAVHLAEGTQRLLRVGERIAILPWPASTLRARARGDLLFVELPQTAFTIAAEHPHLAAILKLVGGPLQKGEVRVLDRPRAGALRRGLMSARTRPSFEVTPWDSARDVERERALVTAERLPTGALEINLGVLGSRAAQSM